MARELTKSDKAFLAEADAWFAYKAATEGLGPVLGQRYQRIEPWCWTQLTTKLKRIRHGAEYIQKVAA